MQKDEPVKKGRKKKGKCFNGSQGNRLPRFNRKAAGLYDFEIKEKRK